MAPKLQRLRGTDVRGRVLPTTTLLAENEGSDYAECRDAQGLVRAWHLAHHIGVFESSGNLQAAHSEFVVRFFGLHIETFPRPWVILGNWMHLRGYESRVRHILTEWQKETAYDELYVAHDSKLLAMSINLANAMLVNTVRVVNDEERLDDLLLDARHRLGV